MRAFFYNRVLFLLIRFKASSSFSASYPIFMTINARFKFYALLSRTSAVSLHPGRFQRRTVLVGRMIVADVIEEEDFVVRLQNGQSERVDGCVSPPLVEEAAGLL